MRIVCGGGVEKSSPAKMMRIPNTCTYFLSQVVEQMLLMRNVWQARRKKKCNNKESFMRVPSSDDYIFFFSKAIRVICVHAHHRFISTHFMICS